MNNHRYFNYRWCAVSECKNTTIRTQGKLWIKVPSEIKMRNTWLTLASRDPKTISTKSKLHFCEDHFDLEKDMENFMRYKIMGYVKKIAMRPNCIPSRFDCQADKQDKSTPSNNQLASVKLQKKALIQDIEDNAQHSLCHQGPNFDMDHSTVKDDAINEAPELSTDGSKMVIKKELDEEIKVIEGEQRGVRKYNKCFMSQEQMERDREILYQGHVIKEEMTIGPEEIQLSGDRMRSLSTDSGAVSAWTSDDTSETVCADDTQPHRCSTRFTSNGDPLTEESPYSCEICSQTLTTKKQLKYHRKRHGDKRLCCSICGCNFLNSSLLNKHMQTHLTENSQNCKNGEKKFIQIRNLTKLRKHTGDRPYCCDICNKKFTRSHNLTIHMRTHTGDKPYCCYFCHKKFSHNYSLTVHTRKHTGDKPYCCFICQKKFTHNYSLTVHIRKHTGDKPYCCFICHKKFSHKYSLTVHSRKHTGDKSNCCEICFKNFNQSGNLTVHKCIHTSDKVS